MSEIRVYFEGDPRLRLGFKDFFAELVEVARQRGASLQLIAGKGDAVRTFMKGLRANPHSHNVLLVDCEGPAGQCSMEDLRKRSDWSPPQGIQVGENRVFWMVQIMESWLLADKGALAEYYDPGFTDGALPANPRIENIPKNDVLNGLKEATKLTKKGSYKKGLHASPLLSRISPERVKQACPNCLRLFDELRQYLTG